MNKNNHGESVKKLCKLAVPISRILKSFSKKIKIMRKQKKTPNDNPCAPIPEITPKFFF
jgi:hypothetical protein